MRHIYRSTVIFIEEGQAFLRRGYDVHKVDIAATVVDNAVDMGCHKEQEEKKEQTPR